MNTADWKLVLSETLNDWKLSRGEKAVLQHMLAPYRDDPHELALVRSTAFHLAREAMVDPTVKTVLPWLEEVIKAIEYRPQDDPRQLNEAWFSPNENCVSRITGLFASAGRRAEICVFTITDDRITEAILEAHQRGVHVRIITDDDKSLDPGSDVARLKSRGVETRTDTVPDHMHHKYALFDRKILLSGSYNWTRSAARANQDNFIVTDNAILVRKFSEHFDQLWQEL